VDEDNLIHEKMFMPFEREFWLYLIFILTAWKLFWGLRDTRRIIEAPFLYAVGMALIVCPQLYIAASNYWRVPDQAYRIFCIMVVLCSIALYWGYSKAGKAKHHSISHIWIIDDNRLFKLGLIVACLGAFGSFQVRSLGEIQAWRGWPVYWYTLSKLALPGISLMLISFFQSKKLYRLVWALGFSIYPFLAIFEAGRRSMTLVLPFIYLLPLLLHKPRLQISRWVIISGLIAAFIVVYAFPYWRGEFKEGNHIEVISERPITQIVGDTFSSESDKTLEIIDGMIVTGAHYEEHKYGWGISQIYNSLIQHYVPGGLIGRDLKDALRLGEGISQEWVSSVYGIPVAFYTAKTAFAELFGAFSFFGSIVVFFLGYLFRRVRDAVVYRFDGRAIIFLCFFLTLPASLAYGGLLNRIVLQVPDILIMLLAFRWCLSKQFRGYWLMPPKELESRE